MPADTRWQALLSSGCTLGVEFRLAWEALRGEAICCTEWLGERLEGSLGQPVEGAGMGCETGATRKAVVEQLEMIQFGESPRQSGKTFEVLARKKQVVICLVLDSANRGHSHQ